MKNIHVLPRVISQNIYITSDEEIKVGDYVINYAASYVFQHYFAEGNLYKECKKIILTTDQDLIKDGVQAIDDEFLEWFVKNPSCEFVELKQLFKDDFGFWVSYLDLLQNEPLREVESKYKIIIPKDEPKQEFPTVNGSYGCTIPIKDETKQETLEELRKWKEEALIAHEINQKVIEKLMAERKLMYSEEDLKEAFAMGRKNATIKDFNTKFKKK